MEKPDFLGAGWGYDSARLDISPTVTTDLENIRQSIWIILTTARGDRVMRPDFGCDIAKLVFATVNTSTTALIIHYVKEALMKWEPRITVKKVIVQPDEENDAQLNIGIDYVVNSSNSSENLVYPFFLENR